MKKLICICTAALLATTPALAVVNGDAVVWQDNDNVVSTSNCTGTRIGRNFVLTAAHCHDGDAQIFFIQGAYDDDIQDVVESVTKHPNFIAMLTTEDVAIVTLTEATDFSRIQFFKDLTIPTYEEGEQITLDGFGREYTPTRAHFELTDRLQNFPSRIEATKTGISYSETGDSGAAWIDSNNEIIAIHHGSSDGVIDGTDLHYAADFILENINGWHYPTIADANGKTTIEVQSLHRDDVTDSAYVTGDATLIIEESTCLNGPIKPFGRCTYVIDSNGRKAKLHLSESEVVRINPNAADATDNTDNAAANPDTGEGTKSGKSGGSLGLLSLSLLAILGTLRRKKVRL